MLKSQIDGAEAYERLMVPALFAEWAPRVARAARIAPAQRVLDLACGTGVLARAAARVVGERGRVSGIDPNPGMLAVARRVAPGVDWHDGAAESLPFPDDSFDAVVSQFGLMFFADRAAALRELQRVLRPGGAFAVAVWASLKANPAYAAEISIVERISGGRAADPLRAPFELGDTDALRRIFIEAGVANVNIVTHEGSGNFPSVQVMIEADLRGWLPVVGVILSEEEIHQIIAESTDALSDYVEPDKSVVFPMSAHIVYGTKS